MKRAIIDACDILVEHEPKDWLLVLQHYLDPEEIGFLARQMEKFVCLVNNCKGEHYETSV